MLATLAAVLLFAPQSQYLTCAVNNNDTADDKLFVEYAGKNVFFCCDGCVPQFGKTPEKFMKTAADAKLTVAKFMFDPTTGKKISEKKARGSSDYMGVRYFFANADAKAKFDKNPKSFAEAPKKEALYCPVMQEPVASYSKADSYVDYDGVRYFMCCAGCYEPMTKDPKKYADPSKAHEPKVIAPAKG